MLTELLFNVADERGCSDWGRETKPRGDMFGLLFPPIDGGVTFSLFFSGCSLNRTAVFGAWCVDAVAGAEVSE
jgi:hypothetical protein